MAEYIKRESIQKALKNVTDDPSCPLFLAAMIEQYIDQEPAADVVEVKHGKWIEVQKENIWNDIVPVLECSACGKYTVGTRGIMTKSNYCPNCGAKMGAEG